MSDFDYWLRIQEGVQLSHNMKQYKGSPSHNCHLILEWELSVERDPRLSMESIWNSTISSRTKDVKSHCPKNPNPEKFNVDRVQAENSFTIQNPITYKHKDKTSTLSSPGVGVL